MKLIAHRGNYKGISKNLENFPEYIDEALKAGYDAEIDVWLIDGEYKLGHDKPQHKVDETWFIKRRDKLWCHAKNIESILPMMKSGLHCFFHNTDAVTLTSKNLLWTYPGKTLTKKSIAVMPDMLRLKDAKLWLSKMNFHGLCSDNFQNYI